MAKCKHVRIEIDECDREISGNDFYKCLDCGAMFKGECGFESGDDPFKIPPVDRLDRVRV